MYTIICRTILTLLPRTGSKGGRLTASSKGNSRCRRSHRSKYTVGRSHRRGQQILALNSAYTQHISPEFFLAQPLQAELTAIKLQTFTCKKHSHAGVRLISTKGGNKLVHARMTERQMHFWNRLANHQRVLVERGSGNLCFQCNLEQAMREERVFEDRLYASLMASLLSFGRETV